MKISFKYVNSSRSYARKQTGVNIFETQCVYYILYYDSSLYKLTNIKL